MSLKRIRLLIWKEFLQLRRDPLIIRMLLLMPVLQLILFGYVVAADVRNLPTAVVDLDHTATSRKIAAEFAGSGYFTITENPAAEDQLRPLLDDGRVKLALVIPEGTQDQFSRGENAPIGIIVDGSDSRSLPPPVATPPRSSPESTPNEDRSWGSRSKRRPSTRRSGCSSTQPWTRSTP